MTRRAALLTLLASLTVGCEQFNTEPVSCGGELVDLGSDPDHCGACGNACSGVRGVASGHCADGACVIDACEAEDGTRRVDANGRPEDGCEVARATCGERPRFSVSLLSLFEPP